MQESDAAKCATEQECNSKALAFQAQEAFSARFAVEAGYLQAAFSFLGLLGLGFTVHYARQAWRESQRAADTAEHALVASIRPHVLVDEIRMSEPGKTASGRVSMRIQLVNTGQSPAFVRQYAGYLQIRDAGEQPTLDIKDLVPQKSLVPILPGQKVGISHSGDGALFISPEDVEGLRSGQSEAFTVGMIDYIDSRGKPYHFRFVYAYKFGRGVFEPHPSDEIWWYSAA